MCLLVMSIAMLKMDLKYHFTKNIFFLLILGLNMTQTRVVRFSHVYYGITVYLH